MKRQLPKVLVGFSGNPERTATLNGARYAEKVTYSRVWNGVGGTSVNFALQLRELGLPVRTIITAGRDHDGGALRAELEGRRLDHHMLVCREATSFATVEIDQDGDRSIRSYKPGYSVYPTEDVGRIVDHQQPDCVVVTGCTAEEMPLVQAMFSAPNALRVLNPRESLCASEEALIALLAKTDILAINAGEYQAWAGQKKVTKQDLSSLHKLGPKTIIVTKGKDGAVVSPGLGCDPMPYPAYKVGDEVDATGAGDAFLSTFLAHHLTGFGLRETIHFSRVVAGIKVTKRGGSNTVTRDEILAHSPEWRAVASFFDNGGGPEPPRTAEYRFGHP